jgi:hypothetical protein
MKKTILVLSTVAFLVICGSAAFAATTAGHVSPPVTVNPVEEGSLIDIPENIQEDFISEVKNEFGPDIELTVLTADPSAVVDQDHKVALEAYIEREITAGVQYSGGGVITPVLFPPVKGRVDFVDGEAAVAFGVHREDLFGKLELDPEEEIESIKHELLHHIITEDGGLSEVIEEVFVHEDAKRTGVYIALVLEKEKHFGRSAGRAAPEEVSFSPVIVRVRQSSGDGGGGGGCNFGFAGMAAILALVGGTCLSRKARG